jgi:hypothetical protein
VDLPSVASPSPPPFVVAFVVSAPPNPGTIAFESEPHFWVAEHPENFSVTTRITVDSVEHTIVHYLKQTPDNTCELGLSIDGQSFDLRNGKLFIFGNANDDPRVQQFAMNELEMEIVSKEAIGSEQSAKHVLQWWRDTAQALKLSRN